jgi:hypothetical protein
MILKLDAVYHDEADVLAREIEHVLDDLDHPLAKRFDDHERPVAIVTDEEFKLLVEAVLLHKEEIEADIKKLEDAKKPDKKEIEESNDSLAQTKRLLETLAVNHAQYEPPFEKLHHSLEKSKETE